MGARVVDFLLQWCQEGGRVVGHRLGRANARQRPCNPVDVLSTVLKPRRWNDEQDADRFRDGTMDWIAWAVILAVVWWVYELRVRRRQ